MKERECRTQADLEKALAKRELPVLIGDCSFSLSGSAQVMASDSAQVRAYGSAQVRASGSAQVRASDSAQVTAYDSAQVTAYGSAQVRAYGSAQVRAYGSAQVTAYGSAQVTAYDSARVTTASKYVAVTKHGTGPKVTGGVLIELPALDTPEAWCEYHGVRVTGRRVKVAHLFKAVSDDWPSDYRTSYAPGSTPKADDWVANGECGGGLHFCARPTDALTYHSGATRYVSCPVRLDEISVIDVVKVKAKRVVAPGCSEVDINGEPVEEPK